MSPDCAAAHCAAMLAGENVRAECDRAESCMRCGWLQMRCNGAETVEATTGRRRQQSRVPCREQALHQVAP
jgi:hypothetical protein